VHLSTGRFSDCLLLWLEINRRSLGINRQINCVEYLFVCQAGFSSRIECEANYFQRLSLLSRHSHLQWLGETSIGRPDNRCKPNVEGQIDRFIFYWSGPMGKAKPLDRELQLALENGCDCSSVN
jgi:hypothetical protein